MSTYIALLRGINVSGQKKVPMADLKKTFEALKFKNVQTYIQSGNVVFECNQSDSEKLESMIEKQIRKDFDFDVPVIIRTPSELQGILKSSPFLKDPKKDKDRMYVTFLAKEPLSEHVKKLDGISYPQEEFVLKNKTIYFFSPNGYGNAKMNNNFFENKLKVSATTRNLKTIQQLIEMADKDN
ncbi:DUF1697 domain-containing protein [bacterium]|nr:DUF1697 domain-containing protein [bacterium]